MKWDPDFDKLSICGFIITLNMLFSVCCSHADPQIMTAMGDHMDHCYIKCEGNFIEPNEMDFECIHTDC